MSLRRFQAGKGMEYSDSRPPIFRARLTGMKTRDVRSGIEQAKTNESASRFAILEMVILSVGSGVLSQSWAIGIGSLLVLMLLFHAVGRSPVASKVVSLIFAVLWAAGAGFFGNLFAFSEGLTAVLVVFTLLVAFGANIHAFQWSRDLQIQDGTVTEGEQ
jgi:hypothetical protein